MLKNVRLLRETADSSPHGYYAVAKTFLRFLFFSPRPRIIKHILPRLPYAGRAPPALFFLPPFSRDVAVLAECFLKFQRVTSRLSSLLKRGKKPAGLLSLGKTYADLPARTSRSDKWGISIKGWKRCALTPALCSRQTDTKWILKVFRDGLFRGNF